MVNHFAGLGLAATLLVAAATGCASPSEAGKASISAIGATTWFAPLHYPVDVSWVRESTDCLPEGTCLELVPFRIDSLDCTDCTLSVETTDDTGVIYVPAPGLPADTVYSEDAPLYGQPSGTGPAVLTAHLTSVDGVSQTVTTQVAVDHVIAIHATCELDDGYDAGLGGERYEACGATRTADQGIRITPTFTTASGAVLDLTDLSGSSDPLLAVAYNDLPAIAPEPSSWTGASAWIDPTTTAPTVTVSWNVDGTQLSGTVVLPTIAM